MPALGGTLLENGHYGLDGRYGRNGHPHRLSLECRDISLLVLANDYSPLRPRVYGPDLGRGLSR